MRGYTRTEIARIVSGETAAESRGGDRCGPRASIDSRTARKRDIFFALSGERTDGHRFVGDALNRGASAAVVERGRLDPDARRSISPEKLIFVDHAAEALVALAAHHRNRFSPFVVAVTGSNGKTTTKDLIASVFAAAGASLASPGNYNNLLGVPLTLLGLDETHRYVAVELGISAPGEMARLGRLVRPDAALITNVNAAHVEGLGDLRAIAGEKLEIASHIRSGGALYLGGDDDLLPREARDRGLSFRTFGVSDRCDIHPVRVEPWRREGIRLKLEGGYRLDVSLHGMHQAANIVGAVAACIGAGIPMETVVKGVGDIRPAPGRFVPEEAGGILLVDDTYNANAASTIAAVEFLSKVECSGRRVLVLGDMLELGDAEEEAHEEVGGAAARAGLDALFLWGERTASVERAALRDDFPPGAVVRAVSHKERFISEIIAFLEPGDVVAVKGSRGMKMEEVVRAIREAAVHKAAPGGV